jgi:cobalt/nickel transport protein
MKTSTGLMIAAVVALAVVPLFIHAPVKDEDAFTGADGQAKSLIGTIQPGYKEWFSPLFEPPSGEIESLLFSLQAALGAGLIGFYFGRARGRQEAAKKAQGGSCT